MNSSLISPHRMTRLLGMLLLLCGLLVLSHPVYAGGSWSQLSERERTVLKPFKKQWASYSTGTRKAMRSWAGLSSAKRATIKKRHAQWNALSASSKAKVISKLNRYKRMPKWKRQKLQAWRKWVKRLPRAEQRKLHKSLPGMSAQQRKAYMKRLEKKYGKP